MLQSIILVDPQATLAAKPDGNTLVVEPKAGESVITIEQIRDLIAWVGQRGFEPGPKRALILQAQRWHFTAPEALLKTLEEPPVDTTIVLTVAQASSMPLTIRSRCAVLLVGEVGDSQLADWHLIASAPPVANAPLPFFDFLALDTSERWLVVDPYLKSKTDVGEWLSAWQQQAAEQPASVNRVNQQAALTQALQDIKGNILPRLVIDNLLLQLSQSHA